MTSTTVRLPIRMSIRGREYGGAPSFGKQLLKLAFSRSLVDGNYLLTAFLIIRIQVITKSHNHIMSYQKNAEAQGITFEKQAPGYLNLCIRSGNQLITSGHVSDLKGKLGAGITVEEGYQAARNCTEKILRSAGS